MDPRCCALITGGTGEVGSAIAVRLIEAGWDVHLADRVSMVQRPYLVSSPHLSETVVDLSVTGNGAAAVRAAVAERGSLDAVVNAIGMYSPLELDDFEWAHLETSFATNVRAPLEVILEARRYLSRAARPRVVNVSSVAAWIGSRDLSYSITKAALTGASRSLARSLGQEGISVFTVSPGVLDTQMARRAGRERMMAHAATTIARRPGRPEEVAALVDFLLTNETEYLAGADIPVCSGLAW